MNLAGVERPLVSHPPALAAPRHRLFPEAGIRRAQRRASLRLSSLSLSLFVPGVLTENSDHPTASYDLAFRANRLDRWFDLHETS